MIEPAPIHLGWLSSDPGAVVADLAALGFETGSDPSGSTARIGNLVLTVSPASAADDGRLEFIAASTDETAGRGPGVSRLRLIGIGWATVDGARAAAEFPQWLFAPAPADELLGAAALVGQALENGNGGSSDASRAGDSGPGRLGPGSLLVLLEPTSEGRIAARLARHGEGPAALYVAGAGRTQGETREGDGASPSAASGARTRGPLGPARLAAGGRSGPFVVVVEP